MGAVIQVSRSIIAESVQAYCVSPSSASNNPAPESVNMKFPNVPRLIAATCISSVTADFEIYVREDVHMSHVSGELLLATLPILVLRVASHQYRRSDERLAKHHGF